MKVEPRPETVSWRSSSRLAQVVAELRRAAPAANVVDDPSELYGYSYDASFESLMNDYRPDVVVQPSGTADVTAAVRIAAAHRIPVTTRGAATGQAAGCVPVRGGIVMDMSRLNRIVELDAPNLQVIIEPGVVHANLNAFLAPHGLIFPPDPGSSKMCTVGGMVANNSRGMRAVKYGSTGDYVLGLEVVLPSGEVVTTGSVGSRALQSSSGLELTKLFVGSEGLLGVICQLRLRVQPLPARRGLVLASFDELEATGRAVLAVFQAGILPAAGEILDRSAIIAVNKYRPAMQLSECEAMLLFEVDGSSVAVAHDVQRVADAVRPHASAVESADDPARVAALWEARSLVGAASGQVIPNAARVYAGEDICVPLARVPEALRGIRSAGERHGLTIVTYGHIASGGLHAAPVINTSDQDAVRRVRIAADEIHQMALRLNGTVTGEHGVGLTRVPYMRQEHGAALDLMRTIKRAIDPHNLFNPGKVIPD
ncbi:MAG: FAD-binding oxidoreductase [Chloroflexi bacterium]|nr:FAD-binding oxidoreductase [Chloroflexota bacterium]